MVVGGRGVTSGMHVTGTAEPLMLLTSLGAPATGRVATSCARMIRHGRAVGAGGDLQDDP